MNKRTDSNDLQDILTQALDSMKKEFGERFDPGNLILLNWKDEQASPGAGLEH